MRNKRHKQVSNSRKKRRLIYLTFGTLLFIYLTLNIIVGENGLLRYMKLRSMRNNLLAESTIAAKQNEDTRAGVEALKKDPDRVEELAREFGLTKKGELIFKFDTTE